MRHKNNDYLLLVPLKNDLFLTLIFKKPPFKCEILLRISLGAELAHSKNGWFKSEENITKIRIFYKYLQEKKKNVILL